MTKSRALKKLPWRLRLARSLWRWLSWMEWVRYQKQAIAQKREAIAQQWLILARYEEELFLRSKELAKEQERFESRRRSALSGK